MKIKILLLSNLLFVILFVIIFYENHSKTVINRALWENNNLLRKQKKELLFIDSLKLRLNNFQIEDLVLYSMDSIKGFHLSSLCQKQYLYLYIKEGACSACIDSVLNYLNDRCQENLMILADYKGVRSTLFLGEGLDEATVVYKIGSNPFKHFNIDKRILLFQLNENLEISNLQVYNRDFPAERSLPR